MPVPSTAIVGPRRSLAYMAPLCAAASIPRAMPETISTSFSVSSKDILDVSLRPMMVALRVPTTATAGRWFKSAMFPLT